MKRTILFVGYESPVETEIGEYIRDHSSEVYFAHTQEQAIRILDDHRVDSVVVNLSLISDAMIIRYITQYHPDVHLVVSANEEIDEIISIFNGHSFSRLSQPLSLEKIRNMIYDKAVVAQRHPERSEGSQNNTETI